MPAPCRLCLADNVERRSERLREVGGRLRLIGMLAFCVSFVVILAASALEPGGGQSSLYGATPLARAGRWIQCSSMAIATVILLSSYAVDALSRLLDLRARLLRQRDTPATATGDRSLVGWAYRSMPLPRCPHVAAPR